MTNAQQSALGNLAPHFFQVAYIVPEIAAAMTELRGAGLQPVADGYLQTEMHIDFAYFDCAAAGASMIEILGFDAAARQFMEQLKNERGG